MGKVGRGLDVRVFYVSVPAHLLRMHLIPRSHHWSCPTFHLPDDILVLGMLND